MLITPVSRIRYWPLIPAKRAFDDRRFFQVEAGDLARVGLDRVGDLERIEVDNRLDRLQAETLLQFAQAVGALVEQLLADCRQIDRLGFALEHGPPIGAVGDLAAQQVFHQAGLLAGGHAQDRQRLARALVDPAGGNLAGAGDADLHPGGVGQVHHVIGHAEPLAPLRFAAGALLVVALLRADDATVALRQPGEAGIAIALAETLLRLAAAMGAEDAAEVLQAQRPADQRVHRDFAVVEAEGVLHGSIAFQARRHLAQRAAGDFFHQCTESDLNRMFGIGSSECEEQCCGPM